MDGPQSALVGYAGYDAIPDKDQPENQPWPKAELDWEPFMTAIYSLLLGGYHDKPFPERLNLDMLRWYRETVHPRNYHNMPYPELWLAAVSYYLSTSKRGGVTRADLTSGAVPIVSSQELDRADSIRQTGIKEAVPGFGRPSASGEFTSSVYSEKPTTPKFRAGQKVRAVLQSSAGHTREYPYVRGRSGQISMVYPVASPAKGTGTGVYEVELADISSRGLQYFLVPVYSVRYSAADLWGKDFVEPNTFVYADAWETYIEPSAGVA